MAGYLASVDDDFRFTIKAPNSVTLTHFSGHAVQKGTGPNPYFLSAVVMLQFEYLNRQKMSGLEDFCEKIDAFLTALRDRTDPWPIAIELRNPNFLKPAYFDLLARGLDVSVNVNNHYEGSAPLTIEKLERLVEERRERFSQIR